MGTALRPLVAFWTFSRQKPLGGVSALIIIVMILAAALANLIAPNDPLKIFAGQSYAQPGTIPAGGSVFLLGGDETGRDLFARVVFGARISLLVAIPAVIFGTIIGATLGMVSGYFGGKLDLFIQRVVDGMMAFPTILLALTIMALIGPGLQLGGAYSNVVIAIGIIMIPTMSRVTRGATLSVKENVYVEAARSIGASNLRVISLYVFPNVIHAIIILAATYLGAAILVEASLSFLGMGTPPPAPSWGMMVAGPGAQSLATHPMLLWAPAISISLAVLAFNLLGDALRDVLDPRMRGTQ